MASSLVEEVSGEGLPGLQEQVGQDHHVGEQQAGEGAQTTHLQLDL